MKIINYLKERWSYFKAFLKITGKRLILDKINLYMLCATVIFFVLAFTGINTGYFLGLVMLWAIWMITRIGVAKEIIDELNSNINEGK